MHAIANKNPKQVFVKSTVAMIGIIILYFIVQYDTNVMEKKQRKVAKKIAEIDTEIKVYEAEYNALTSPIRIRHLSDSYLPHFEDIKISSKIQVKNLGN